METSAIMDTILTLILLLVVALVIIRMIDINTLIDQEGVKMGRQLIEYHVLYPDGTNVLNDIGKPRYYKHKIEAQSWINMMRCRGDNTEYRIQKIIYKEVYDYKDLYKGRKRG